MTTPCPRCGHPLLAEATTSPDGQRTHPWCQHGPLDNYGDPLQDHEPMGGDPHWQETP